ncbi:MAG TPA: polysaccharide deacetylase family protein [Thermoanaerobaculia bacterium]|nr:polysaccharide deacetylase family protein [Thermoanaerobaculia bacterium]
MWRSSPLAAVATLFVSHVLLLYPTLKPDCQWFGPVITGFRTDRKEVWLTIDDGPSDESLPLLDLLDRYQARATFFVKGALCAGQPEQLRTIIERGHQLGNHSQTHPSATFWCLPPGRIADEIDGCSESITGATGREVSLFRAPIGHKNPFVHPMLSKRNMTLIGWSARGFDAVASSPERSAAMILKNVRPGAIILLHEGHMVDGRSMTYRCIELVLQSLASDGYDFVIPAVGSFDTGARNVSR